MLITGSAPDAAGYEALPPHAGYLQLRLSERGDIQAVAASAGRIDVLVNNAGGTGGAFTPYDFDTAVSVNLNAVFHLTEGLADAAYGAAKAAIVQLTRSFCVSLAPRGIRVNAVLPGSIPTPMTNPFAEDPGVHKMVCDATPLARWGEPREIADAVMFLASPAASFVSGHTLVVDGGYSIMK